VVVVDVEQGHLRIGVPFGGHSWNVPGLEISDSGARILDHGPWLNPNICGESSDIPATVDTAQCAAVGERGLVAGALDLLLPQTIRGLPARDQLLVHREGDLDRERRHRLHHDVLDRGVERAAVDRLTAVGLPAVQPPASTPVSRDRLGMVRVIVGRHPLAAGATDDQALQEGGPFTRGALSAFGRPGGGIRLDLAHIRLVLGPGDPLANITNTTAIRAVVANGRYFDRAALDGLLDEARNESHSEAVIVRTGSARADGW